MRGAGELFSGIHIAINGLAVLPLVERAVPPPQLDQFAVGPPLGNLPGFQHQNLIGRRDRRQAVRDDEGRSPRPQLRQPFLNQRFALGIE